MQLLNNMKSEQECIEYFVSSFLDEQHGNDYFIAHCMGVYTILKQMGSPLEICIAGLYHSVYGTEHFTPVTRLTKHTVKEYIGERSEDLVSTFCSLKDRDISILKNLNNYDERKRKDLLYINYANLMDQSQSLDNPKLKSLLTEYQSALSSTSPVFNDTKNIIEIYDDLISSSDLDWMHTYCLNSQFTCGHASNPLGYERDSRFSSQITNNNLESSGVLSVVKLVSEQLKQKLYIGNCYINHYQLMTSTSKHTDSALPNTFTILIFCNKYWEEPWGGELKIYKDKSKTHSIIDYVSGRVVIFDSRIEHKVMPLTHAAKKDRFTIAVKCSNIEGLQNLISMYGDEIIDVQ